MSHSIVLYRVEGLPVLQNRVYSSAEEARTSPKGDVELVQDTETGLIRNRAFDPSLITYDTDYQNEQALSPRFRRHLEQVSKIVSRHLSGRLLEVGCGKGFFLEVLQARGFDVRGMDPAYEGDNPRIARHAFEPGCGVKADDLILRHMLEHVSDPLGFLARLAEANEKRGRLYIEVPCFDWIIENRAWFDIFYEHVNYFRLDDFQRMFSTVYESGRIFGGQYLYAVVDIGSLRTPTLGDLVTLSDDFISSVEDLAENIRQFSKKTGRSPFVWGASSKGVIFSLMMQRRDASLAGLVDINPAKQGAFAPVSGLQILEPRALEEQAAEGDLLLVMNRNYMSEIREMTNGRYRYVAVDAVL